MLSLVSNLCIGLTVYEDGTDLELVPQPGDEHVLPRRDSEQRAGTSAEP